VKNVLLSTATAVGRLIEIWFQDEARVGQKGGHADTWAVVGSRPLMVRDNRHDSAYLSERFVRFTAPAFAAGESHIRKTACQSQ